MYILYVVCHAAFRLLHSYHQNVYTLIFHFPWYFTV